MKHVADALTGNEDERIRSIGLKMRDRRITDIDRVVKKKGAMDVVHEDFVLSHFPCIVFSMTLLALEKKQT